MHIEKCIEQCQCLQWPHHLIKIYVLIYTDLLKCKCILYYLYDTKVLEVTSPHALPALQLGITLWKFQHLHLKKVRSLWYLAVQMGDPHNWDRAEISLIFIAYGVMPMFSSLKWLIKLFPRYKTIYPERLLHSVAQIFYLIHRSTCISSQQKFKHKDWSTWRQGVLIWRLHWDPSCDWPKSASRWCDLSSLH